MFAGLNGWHLVIILAVILLLFGAAKLPALAKSMGQSARVFKGEMKAMKDEDAARDSSTDATVQNAPVQNTAVQNPPVQNPPVQNTVAPQPSSVVTPPHDADNTSR